MSLRRHLRLSLLAPLGTLVLGCALAMAAPAQKHAALSPFLPTDFSGWHQNATPRLTADPQVADATSTGPLKEFGLTVAEDAAYQRGTDTLTLHAMRFIDATGAYAAYTFYRPAGWPKAEIGRGGASNANRVLFWSGNTVVDASFSHVTAMSAAELRELEKGLPQIGGAASTPPSLPGFLPKDGLEAQSSRYSLGQESYQRNGVTLPPALVDFTRGAEVLTASYSFRNGHGTLTLINYPTPQIAANRAAAITAFLKAGNTPQAPWSPALLEGSRNALQVRRSGPLVAVTSGNLSEADARKMLGQINYQAELTWNRPQGYISEAAKAARLLVGVITLIGILCGSTLLLALFLGFGRILYRKLTGKPLSSLEEEEFIHLDLNR